MLGRRGETKRRRKNDFKVKERRNVLVRARKKGK